jgi:hypothetical protein
MNASPLVVSLVAGFLVIASHSLRAEEKNGVLLSVQKKTLDRNDTRGGYYYADRIDRTQGLQVKVRNTSFKPQPEGEVEWTIIVRRAGYTTGGIEGFTGVEKLKGLAASETVEMVMGAAQITGWNYYDSAKDKMEYQVIVKQDGAEKVRFQTTQGFDAKRARITKASSDKKDSATSESNSRSVVKPRATPVPATPRPAPATPRPLVKPGAAQPTPRPAVPPKGSDAPLNGGALEEGTPK